MEETIKTLIRNMGSLFGKDPAVCRVKSGFSNTVYSVNDAFILKICTDPRNEAKFRKEIGFYRANTGCDLFPGLILSGTDKTEIPYLYEVIEKLSGVSLYDVWHKTGEAEREDIIKQLCGGMKWFHSHKGEAYDWAGKTVALCIAQLEKAGQKNLFTRDESSLLHAACARFTELLKTDEDEFVLVHNDLHFDNILYHDGKIKLIDFERSLVAPRDFELDIPYRMIRKPWKFADEENERYTKLSDYENIMLWIEKYYPELIRIEGLYRRLAAYDMVYYLKQYVAAPQHDELKNDVLQAAEIVLGQ